MKRWFKMLTGYLAVVIFLCGIRGGPGQTPHRMA